MKLKFLIFLILLVVCIKHVYSLNGLGHVNNLQFLKSKKGNFKAFDKIDLPDRPLLDGRRYTKKLIKHESPILKMKPSVGSVVESTVTSTISKIKSIVSLVDTLLDSTADQINKPWSGLFELFIILGNLVKSILFLITGRLKGIHKWTFDKVEEFITAILNIYKFCVKQIEYVFDLIPLIGFFSAPLKSSAVWVINTILYYYKMIEKWIDATLDYSGWVTNTIIEIIVLPLNLVLWMHSVVEDYLPWLDTFFRIVLELLAFLINNINDILKIPELFTRASGIYAILFASGLIHILMVYQLWTAISYLKFVPKILG